CPGAAATSRVARQWSAGELEPLGLRLEARAEDRGVERIRKAIAHEGGVLVLDIHVELADVVHQEIHDGAVVRELPARKHHLVRALLVELAQPGIALVWVHIPSPLTQTA